MGLFQTRNTKIDVFVELLDEGSEAWRPTKALKSENGLFELLATSDYDPKEEFWAFLPGTLVNVEERVASTGETCLFVKHADPNVIRILVESDDTFILRSVNARNLGNNLFEILATPHYNPEEERWKFPPGSIVAVEEKEYSWGKELVAITPK